MLIKFCFMMVTYIHIQMQFLWKSETLNAMMLVKSVCTRCNIPIWYQNLNWLMYSSVWVEIARWERFLIEKLKTAEVCVTKTNVDTHYRAYSIVLLPTASYQMATTYSARSHYINLLYHGRQLYYAKWLSTFIANIVCN